MSRAILKDTEDVKIYIQGTMSNLTSSPINVINVRVNVLKGLCFKALISQDLVKHYLDTYGKLKLFLDITDNEAYDILMLDPNRFNGIRFNEESYEGDKLTYDSADLNVYDIEIRSEELDKRDIEADCEEYVTETYQDCIEREAKKDLVDLLGCNVPWFTSIEQTICRFDTPNITTKVQQNLIQYMDVMNSYTVEMYASSKMCKKSCRSLTIIARKSNSFDVGSINHTLVYLFFNPSVKNTKYILKVNHLDLLVNVGSSLGLWLGLSLFSAFQSIKGIGARFRMRVWFQQLFFPIIGGSLIFTIIVIFFYFLISS